MGLDIRLPIGMMFALIGFMLFCSGFLTRDDAELYQRSLGININLVWGGVLFLFGSAMLFFAMLSRNASKREAATTAIKEVHSTNN